MEELLEDCVAFSRWTHDWTMRQQDKIESLQTAHEVKSKKLEANISAQHREKTLLHEQLHAQHAAITGVKQDIARLESELHGLMSQADALPTEIVKLKQDISAARAQQTKLIESKKRLTEILGEKVSQMKAAVSLFESALGLRLEPGSVPDQISCTFIYIDPSRPNAEFTCTLRVVKTPAEGSHFRFVDMEPKIANWESIALPSELLHCMIAIRTQFQELVA